MSEKQNYNYLSAPKKYQTVPIYYAKSTQKFTPNENTKHISVYTGKQMKKPPTFSTKTGNKKNPTFHGGIYDPLFDNTVYYHHGQKINR